MNRSEPKFYFTQHVEKRMKERKINRDQIKRTILNGCKFDEFKIKCGNVFVIFNHDKQNNQINVITTYNSNDIVLNDYEQELWIELFKLIQTKAEIDYEEKFEEIEQKFELQKNKTITFEQFLEFDDSIIVYNKETKSKEIFNMNSNSLLSISFLTGNIDVLNILLFEYELELTYENDNDEDEYYAYTPLHVIIKKLGDYKDDIPITKSFDFIFDMYKRNNKLADFDKLLNEKCDHYSLLHRCLYYGFDNIAAWLINHGIDISTTKDNRTKYNETVYDLAELNKDKLPISYDLLLCLYCKI